MALLTGYTHDIFVSYAHNDNQPLVSGEEGWVRTLINLLRVRTVEKIGSNALDIWMDYESVWKFACYSDNHRCPDVQRDLAFHRV